MLTAGKIDDVRYRNRRRVLSVVRRKGVASRTAIGDASGLSAATVSAITADFLEEGILVPPPNAKIEATGRGRPKVALVVNPNAAMACVVYFYLNRVSAAMIDYSGASISEHTEELSLSNITADQIRETLISCISKAIVDSGQKASRLQRIMVGFQGVVDVAETKVLWTPICGETDMPVAEWLEEYFNAPTKVANDCNMIAQALNWRDPKKYTENFGAVLLSHGVGMGLFLRGSIIKGTHSSGLEFGHMNYIPDGALCRCGNLGCIEAYAGDYAISRRAKGEEENAPPHEFLENSDMESIIVAARAGDQMALAAIRNAGAAIGTGLASLFALVDPFPVVLVGPGAAGFDLMEDELRNAMSKSPGVDADKSIEIDCLLDQGPLVQEGCAITALLDQDDDMAVRRFQVEQAS